MEKKNFIEFVERIENNGPVGKAFIQLLKTGWIVVKHVGLLFKSLYDLAKECYIWFAHARIKYCGPVHSLTAGLFIYSLILTVVIVYYKSELAMAHDQLDVQHYKIEKELEQRQLDSGIDMYRVGVNDGIDSMRRENKRQLDLEQERKARWAAKQKELQRNDSIKSNS